MAVCCASNSFPFGVVYHIPSPNIKPNPPDCCREWHDEGSPWRVATSIRELLVASGYLLVASACVGGRDLRDLREGRDGRVGTRPSLRGGCRLPTWGVPPSYMGSARSLHGGFDFPTWKVWHSYMGKRFPLRGCEGGRNSGWLVGWLVSWLVEHKPTNQLTN